MFFMIIWFIVGCSIVFFLLAPQIPKYLFTSFPLALGPHYNPSKVLLIVYVHIAFLVVANLRSLW